MKCKVCDSSSNDYITLNEETIECGGIEIAINRQGMLRARHYPIDGLGSMGGFDDQDIVNIDFCPSCGRKF